VEAMIKSLANKLIQQQQQQQAANSSASGPDSAVRPRANGIVFDEFISVCVKLQVINKKKNNSCFRLSSSKQTNLYQFLFITLS